MEVLFKDLESYHQYSIINDTAEYSEWNFNIRIEGLINGGASFGIIVSTKIGGAIIG